MTTKKAMVGFLAAFGVAAVSVAGPATASDAPAISPTSVSTIAVSPATAMQLLPSVSLACSGMGASDVRHRGHSIKNTTGHPIPAGTSVHWTSSDKGSGSVKLAKDLAPNDTIDVIEPGQTNGYTCNASFYPGNADFVIKGIAHNGTSAVVTIANANPWTDAAASKVKVDAMNCLSTTVGSVTLAVPKIPKGGSVQVTATLPGSDYVRATANSDGAVPETNKANNAGVSPDYSSNKSCVPQ